MKQGKKRLNDIVSASALSAYIAIIVANFWQVVALTIYLSKADAEAITAEHYRDFAAHIFTLVVMVIFLVRYKYVAYWRRLWRDPIGTLLATAATIVGGETGMVARAIMKAREFGEGILKKFLDRLNSELKTENQATGEARGIAIGEARGIAIGEARGITIGEARGITIGEARGIARSVIRMTAQQREEFLLTLEPDLRQQVADLLEQPDPD